MVFDKLNEQTYLLRLEKGEEIVTSLQHFIESKKITNGKFEGIGSIESPTLAHYKVDTQKYSEKQIEGVFEITTLLGNISIFEQKPLIHSHITIGNEQMQVFGGHLVKGLVSATAEIIITTYTTSYKKEFNKDIGLKLWTLEGN